MGIPINVILKGTHVEFNLTNNRDKSKESLLIKASVDDYMKHISGTTCWYLKKERRANIYYMRRLLILGCGKHTTPMFHRVVVAEKYNLPEYDNSGNAEEIIVVDHINRDSLDNRIENLRIVSAAENCRNQEHYNAGYIHMGIKYCFIEKRQRFQAYDGRKFVGNTKTRDELHLKIEKYLKNKEVINENIR